MGNLVRNTEIDTTNVVHDLLKKANKYYQKRQIDLSILCFNEVLNYEPRNAISLHFIKVKLQQFEKEKSVNPSAQIALSLSIIHQDYQTAFSLINDNTNSIFIGTEYDQLRDALREKLINQLKSNIGSLEQTYIISVSTVANLSVNEIKIFDKFRKGLTPKQLLDTMPQNAIKLLTIMDKLISKSYIKKFFQKKSNLIHLNGKTQNQANVVLNQESVDKPKIQEDYDSLFKKATAAYVRRNYKQALELFTKCQVLNPDNSKVIHNIKKLKERLA